MLFHHLAIQGPVELLPVPPAALMQFMGDQSKSRGKDSVNLLYDLLKVTCEGWCRLTGGPG